MKLAVRVFEPGEFLVRQGEAGAEVFLIREGDCDVLVSRDGEGDNPKRVATRSKGDFIGEMKMAVSVDENEDAAVEFRCRSASVRAVTRVTATVLSKSDMRWAVDHDYSLDGEALEAAEWLWGRQLAK
jgi:protein serine kinase H